MALWGGIKISVEELFVLPAGGGGQTFIFSKRYPRKLAYLLFIIFCIM